MWMRRARRMRTLRLVHAVMALQTRRDVDFGGARTSVRLVNTHLTLLHPPDATRQIPPSTAGELFFT